MSSTTLIISDLHMSGDNQEIEAFRTPQEEHLIRMLAHYSSGRYQYEPVELVINGDWLDFLFTPPFLAHLRYTTAEVGLEKIATIANAHIRAFAALRTFLANPQKRMTVLLGNHDIELRFAVVRQAVIQAIFGAVPPPESLNLHFWLHRVYQPYPDVHIEHGNEYDAYNVVPGLYDIPEGGSEPAQIQLPFGSVFVERVYIRLKEHFPYLDQLDPPLAHAHFVALLLVLDRPLVMELLPAMATLHAHPHEDAKTPDTPIPPQHPLGAILSHHTDLEAHHIFTATLQELQRLRSEAHEHVGHPIPAPQEHEHDMSLWIDILSGHPVRALQRLFASGDYQLSRQVAAGAQDIIKARSDLRWVIMGHTHQLWRVVTPSPQGSLTQTYLNTGTWGTRLRLPGPTNVSEQMLHWLQHPTQGSIPLQDVTTTCFVRLERDDNEQATRAGFFVWDDQGERPLNSDELDGTV